jgi:RNA polymerase sigma factor (sigma-70 family)
MSSAAAGPTDADADLVLAARGGDAGALGRLLVRHRPALLAVAIGLLGYCPEAEDAVQDASLAAVRRIGDLRDPNAAGPWLRMIVRNACLGRLRADSPVPLGDELPGLPSAEPDPAELLEDCALRDWVWQGIGELSAPLRLVLMLRYFTELTSYQEIAVACGIPVGTVRSRLAEARGRLARSLSDSTDHAYDGFAGAAAQRRREAEEMIGSVNRGCAARMNSELWLPTVEALDECGKRTHGFAEFARCLEQDVADGVRGRVLNVVGARDMAIWEIGFTFLNDLGDLNDETNRCAPGVVWMLHLHDGRVDRVRIAQAQPPTLTAPGADAGRPLLSPVLM